MSVFTGFVNNVTLLLSLVLLHRFVWLYLPGDSYKRNLVSGLLFGVTTIFTMILSVEFAPGIIFDARSIVLSMAGLFGGPVVALISAGMAASFRIYLGGTGMWVGLAIIAVSTLAGSAGYVMRRNQHLQELDHLKSLFIAFMSHELRTLLNSIIGFTGMILQLIPEPINDKQQDYLERLANPGRQLLALISEVIDIAMTSCAMTSCAMSGDRERLLAAGFTGYIEKPVDPMNVINQIRDIVGEK